MICKHCKREIKLCATLYTEGRAHCDGYVHSDDNFHICNAYSSASAEPLEIEIIPCFSDGTPIEIYDDLKDEDIHFKAQFLGDWE